MCTSLDTCSYMLIETDGVSLNRRKRERERERVSGIGFVVWEKKKRGKNGRGGGGVVQQKGCKNKNR